MNGFGGRTIILKLHENVIIVNLFLDSETSITVDASSLQGFDELSEEDFNVFHEGFMVGLGLGPVSVHMDPCPAEEEGEVKEFTELKPPSFISQIPSLATLKPTPFIESEKGDSFVLLPNLLLPEDLVAGTLLFSDALNPI